ncbi:hypothetical protein HY310_03250 [Candidatus Microgenomates bacterium]|nr:hypothetical protein [Candidatus Microgenomates bacterium]
MLKKIITAFLILIFCSPVLKPAFATTLAKVEYNLPYPGVLPDSPVYSLKVVRDNLVTFFIFEQKQKAFYQLFLADKRMAAAKALFDKGSINLGATTIVKSQEYFSNAVDLAVKNKDESLIEKLIVSSVKHEEAINDLLPKTKEGDLEKMNKSLSASLKDKKRVMEVLKVK